MTIKSCITYILDNQRLKLIDKLTIIKYFLEQIEPKDSLDEAFESGGAEVIQVRNSHSELYPTTFKNFAQFLTKV